MDKSNQLKIPFSIGIVGLIFIGGAVLFQWYVVVKRFEKELFDLQRNVKDYETQLQELSSNIDALGEEVNDLKTQKTAVITEQGGLRKQIYDLAVFGFPLRPEILSPGQPQPARKFVRITAPKEGEQLCLGKEYVIRWENEGFSEVSILVGRASKVGGSYLEFGYPANLNETGKPGEGTYIWKVGNVGTSEPLFLPPGSYRLTVGNAKSDPFSIVQCD